MIVYARQRGGCVQVNDNVICSNCCIFFFLKIHHGRWCTQYTNKPCYVIAISGFVLVVYMYSSVILLVLSKNKELKLVISDTINSHNDRFVLLFSLCLRKPSLLSISLAFYQWEKG